MMKVKYWKKRGCVWGYSTGIWPFNKKGYVVAIHEEDAIESIKQAISGRKTKKLVKHFDYQEY